MQLAAKPNVYGNVMESLANLWLRLKEFLGKIKFGGDGEEGERGYILSIPAELHAEFSEMAQRRGQDAVEEFRNAIKMWMVVRALQQSGAKIIIQEAGEQREIKFD